MPVCEPVPLIIVDSACMVLVGSVAARPVNATDGFLALLDTL